MSKQVVKIEDFKIEKVKLSEVKTNKKGGKVVYINYDYGDLKAKRLRIYFPKMKSPFGVAGFDGTATNKNDQLKVSQNSNDLLELSIPEERKYILEKLKQIDELLLDYAVKHSKELFGKKHKEEIVKAFYISSIKYSIDKEGNLLPYPPRLKCKLNKNDNGVYSTDFFDSNKKKLDLSIDNYSELLPPMSDIMAIIDVSTWVVSGKFGTTYRPVQSKIYKNENSLTDYAFDDSDDEGNDDRESVNQVADEIDELNIGEDDLDS